MGEPLDPVADLSGRLAREADSNESPRLPLGRVRSCVRTWWATHELGDHPAAVGKRVALALIEQPRGASKLAGVLVLGELLGPHLRATDLAAFARLFADGHLDDWTTVDAFTMKVLVTLLDRGPGRRDVARHLAQWRASAIGWQRRAGCLAFVKLARDGDRALAGLVDHVLAICATIVWSHERHDQTAVGCVLRELTRAEPVRVAAFVRRHALLMSKECVRQAVARLPAPARVELLAHHRRATALH